MIKQLTPGTNLLIIDQKKYIIFSDYKKNWYVEDLQEHCIKKAININKNKSILTCDFCDKTLNSYEKEHFEKTKEMLCIDCFYNLKKMIKEAGFETKEEVY